jgi:MFS family permease
VATAVAVGTVTILPGFLTGAMSLQVRRELHLAVSATGLAVGVFFLAAALGSAAGGAVAERVGSRAAMRAAAGGSAVALATIALLARSLAVLLAALALAGLANALAQPAINAFLAERVAEGRRGVVFGLKQSAIPAAVLLSGLAVPAVALTVGWRWTYGLGAVAAVLVGLRVGSAPGVEPPAPGPSEERARPRASGPLRRLALAAVLASAGPNALGAYLVTTAVAAGLGEADAGLLLAVGSGLSILARVAVGWRADRQRSHRLTPMVAMLAGGAVGFALLAVSEPLAVVVGALLAFALGWGWPGVFNLSVVSRHLEAPAAASGVTQTGIYAGAAAGPALFGLLAATASLAAAWTVTAGLALGGAALVALAERRYRAPALASHP